MHTHFMMMKREGKKEWREEGGGEGARKIILVQVFLH